MGAFFKKDIRYTEILFPYAYNILGSSEDAKDTVQDVLTTYLSTPKDHITNEKNYLIRSVVNLAINLKERQKKIISGEGLWLPEPVATDDAADKNLHLNEILSYSLLVLMEKLNARERAVFILKESFDYSHAEIANILSISEENSRKLLSRAKESIFKPSTRRSKEQTIHERNVLDSLMSAIRTGDIEKLENVMSTDIRFYADGGGKVPLLTEFSMGSGNVAALQMLVFNRYLHAAKIVYAIINHQPALLSYINGRLTACQIFELHPDTDKVMQINAVLDPDKLKSLSQKYSQN